MTYDASQLCTYRPYLGRQKRGPVCGRPEADEDVHSWPTERKRPGTHIWRNEAVPGPRPTRTYFRGGPGPKKVRSRDYERGYNSGYVAGRRSVISELPR